MYDQVSAAGAKIAAGIMGLFFAVLSLLATVRGLAALGEHEGVYATGLFLLAAVLFVCVLLCSLGSVLSSAVAHLANIQRHTEELAMRAQGDAEIATERWEILSASLGKLDGTERKTKASGVADDDWDPTSDEPEKPTIIKAKCFKCGKTVKAKADWAGRMGKCPGCGASINFPDAAAV